MKDSMDRWLDVAMSEYASVSVPLGFEMRTVAKLREEQPRRAWGWAVVAAFAAIVVAALTFHGFRVAEMSVAPIAEQIRVPAIDKGQLVTAPHHARAARASSSSVRGVPIVATPLTAQEQALLRLVRNARAKQYAGLVSKPEDLSKEVDPLEFKQMEIPALGREEKQ